MVALELPSRSAPRRAASFWARTGCFACSETLLSSPGVAKVTLNRCSAFQCKSPRALVVTYREAVSKKPTVGEETPGISFESSNTWLRKGKPLGRISPFSSLPHKLFLNLRCCVRLVC